MKPALENSVRARPSVLIVDDEPAMLELVRDVLDRTVDCRVISASSIHEAKRILDEQTVQVVLLDVNLPDGDGMSLLPVIREKHPTAQSVVITGQPSLDGAIGAIRAGVSDFLPKPFAADDLRGRVDRAIQRQALEAKIDTRLGRLRRAVRGLNVSRRKVSKKVDLLCNDLVSAYGELSRQLDVVRTQENFRKLAHSAKDLEQLLCHAMDWVLRHAGYSNVAVWLASDQGESELGAYMKYTIAGEKEFTEAMKEGLLPLVHREGFVHLSSDEIAAQLTETEVKSLAGQTLMAVNCTYLGETLATFVAFRDSRSPFSEEDGAMLKAISPLFAVALASVVRKTEGDLDEDGNPFYDDSDADNDHVDDDRNAERDRDREKKKREDKERHSADWWKRGEPPPF
ncbi:MAG: response regulator [Anaerolineae bacterium]|nr:response regulator [Phycisphaerae bacterium]